MKTIALSSLGQWAQTARFGLSTDQYQAIMDAASALHAQFAQLVPVLDRALTQPVDGLWQHILQVHPENPVDNGLSVSMAAALCMKTSAIKRAMHTLSPVLCPKLNANLQAQLQRLVTNTRSIQNWVDVQEDVSLECQRQAMDDTSLRWRAEFAGTPGYFDAPTPELMSFRSMAIHIGKELFMNIQLGPQQSIGTLRQLLNLIQAQFDHMNYFPTQINRLRVDADTPNTLVVVFNRPASW